MKRLLPMAAVLALAVVSCSGSDEVETSPDRKPTSTAAESTTATDAETTTTQPPEPVLQWAAEDGWRYTATLERRPDSPSASPGGCIDTAPPGFTNMVWTLTIHNELDDREAPVPNVLVADNLNEDGTAVRPDATIVNAPTLRLPEITPNAPDARCILGHSISDEVGDIPAGGERRFTVVAGPMSEGGIEGVGLAIRAFQPGLVPIDGFATG